jgi:hypothetical protein
MPNLFLTVGHNIYTSFKVLFVSSVRGSPRVEIIPDDCSITLVSSVLISMKNAGKSFNKGGPEAAGGTTIDELA